MSRTFHDSLPPPALLKKLAALSDEEAERSLRVARLRRLLDSRNVAHSPENPPRKLQVVWETPESYYQAYLDQKKRRLNRQRCRDTGASQS